MRKPLITFCDIPYSIFSKKMVIHSENPWELQRDIKKLIKNYKFDEKQLVSYFAAHIECSEKINLFTDLLNKKSRHKTKNNISLSLQYKNLATYTSQRIFEEIKRIHS